MKEPPMKTLPDEFIDKEQESVIITTTLYDLIAAINSEVSPEEDALVIATVMALLNSGRVRFLGERNHYN
jgi:hypothetical protein